MSKKHSVLLTRRLPETAVTQLSAAVDLEINPIDEVMSREALLAGVKGKDGLLCLLTDQIDAEVMDAAGPNLKIIANYAVGFNNIDLEAAAKRNIMVTNTPGVLTETSADLAFALIMSVGRRVVEADAYVRSGQWTGWGPIQFLGTDIYGSTLGIIGMGRIGKAVARRASGFGMKVLYWNRTRFSAKEEKKLGLTYCKFNEVLKASDFLSIHLAYNKETHHLIDAAALQKMKQSAFLINTSRGAIIDESALAEALVDGKIAGAGLDVFEEEPTIHSDLLGLKNVVLLPHIGSASTATREKMAVMAVENLLDGLKGKRPENLV